MLVLEAVSARMMHRGPDEAGCRRQGRALLAHRRLRIIDLTSGQQPLTNEDSTIWVTFNGEIYNFATLREVLETKGHRFTTHSDTEVIVHAYEEYGSECVQHFRGMFAFAVWDEPRQRLFLARDRVGKKPLFYASVAGQFLFASELQALVAHPAVSREVDAAAVDAYLTYGYIPAPGTIYRNVLKLPPACHLTVTPETLANPRIERYWQLMYLPKQTVSEAEAAEGLLEVLTEAVRLRMIADVPLGALLSGGVDSSLVVALMSRLSSTPVKTFSVGFEEQEFNEQPYARKVAEHCGTQHHELVVRANAAEILPRLVRHYGEPFADSSALPTYLVAQLTRQHVTVALNGDGGDECFAGYERYLGQCLAERYQRIPGLMRRGLIEPLARLVPERLPRRHRLRMLKRFVDDASRSPGDRYVRWVSYFRPETKHELYDSEFMASLNTPGDRWLRQRAEELERAGLDCLDTVLALDVDSYLPYDLLVKVDITTMAHSLEARSPFLDHKVMEYSARLPRHFKIRRTTLKYLLKKVAERLLPAEVLHRRKMGFGIPVSAWLRGDLRDLVQDTLLSPTFAGRGYFRPEAVRSLVDEHLSGRRDHGQPLWALLFLELWHREFVP